MAELGAASARARGAVSGWLVGAVVAAALCALMAAGALVWASREHDAARTHRAELRAELAASTTGRGADRLAAARTTIASVQQQLDAIPGQLHQVAGLERSDAELVKAALDAGKAGNVPAYNDAVGKRNVLASQVDAAVEKLRTDANAVLSALATVTNRTVP